MEKINIDFEVPIRYTHQISMKLHSDVDQMISSSIPSYIKKRSKLFKTIFTIVCSPQTNIHTKTLCLYGAHLQNIVSEMNGDY